MTIEYKINDPWDWVTHFEDELSNYCGYNHGIACDSNSNAIRLVLHYLEITNQYRNSCTYIRFSTKSNYIKW